MDEILYLEPDEEITSVIDKLKKSESESVGLVIPRNSTLIHSIVNLKLLKKEAENLSKEIALVTGDKIGKNIASQVGLLVYEDVHAKRPVNPLSMPDLPKGDEVIEVDQSGGQTDEPATRSGKNEPKVKHYTETTADRSDKPREMADDEETGEESTKSHHSTFVSKSVHAAHLTADDDDATTVRHEKKSYQSMTRREVRPNKGAIIALVIFALLIGATVLGLPQSWISLTVAAEPFEQSVAVTIDTAAPSTDASTKTVPGKAVDVTNDDARRVVATGKKDVGTKAKGTVTIANAWETNSMKFAAGTTFTSTDGKVFALSEDTTVPGATISLSQGQLVTNPGSTTATIQAQEPGESYNIKAGRFTIGGLTAAQQQKITAESSKDFSGGQTKTVNVMTQSDIDAAKDSLLEDLTKDAAEKMKKDAKDLKIITESIVRETLSVETNPAKVDSETDYFDIKVKAKHQAIAFDEKEVQMVVDAGIRQVVPADKELLLGEGDEFVVSVLGKDYAKGKLELESKIKTKVGTRIDAAAAKKSIAGKTETAARDELAKLPNLKDISIKRFPGNWWQDISFFGWNTRVKVVYE